MELFECTIFTFSNQVLKVKAQHVKFQTLHEGEITILPGHENKKFILSAGKILVQMPESKIKGTHDISDADIHTKDYAKTKDLRVRSYYNGPGYGRFNDGILDIFAFPILQEHDENLEKQLESLGAYGVQLKESWSLY